MAKGKGRKGDLTPELIELICSHIEGGLSNKDAARLSGVSESGFYKWKARGETEEEQGLNTIYVDFVQSLKKALSTFKAYNLQLIQAAAKQSKHWTAAAWLLERKFHNEFGKRVNLHGELDHRITELPPINIVVNGETEVIESNDDE